MDQLAAAFILIFPLIYIAYATDTDIYGELSTRRVDCRGELN
ncbi:hypothetical protein T10_396 [Trichinella papuae]|uniref:Uncharacterized protein n=1 Tax=Trichinella papuae TaxID=268474 RepID=A0A0V1MCB9_9BILA|nr:hypothetical protein T10_396 [Trichinella papuae]